MKMKYMPILTVFVMAQAFGACSGGATAVAHDTYRETENRVKEDLGLLQGQQPTAILRELVRDFKSRADVQQVVQRNPKVLRELSSFEKFLERELAPARAQAPRSSRKLDFSLFQLEDDSVVEGDENLAQQLDDDLAQQLDDDLAQQLDEDLAQQLDDDLAQELFEMEL